MIYITTHTEALWREQTYELADAWTPTQIFREEIGLRAFRHYQDTPAEIARKLGALKRAVELASLRRSAR